jgi:glutaredoxin
MKKIITVVIVALLAVAVWSLVQKDSVKKELSGSNSKQTEKKDEMALFVSATCPHCKRVEEWLQANSEVKEKSGMVMKEVNGNRENIAQLIKKGEECGFDQKSKGAVPLLYDHGQCILGDQPIIDYLSQKYK